MSAILNSSVPAWVCIPFVGLLLCIAVMPLLAGEWWENHQPLVVGIWVGIFVVLFGVSAGFKETAEIVAECILDDYLSFIVLLFGLFCVSGNISVEGDLVGSPRVNTAALLIGTLLSSVIGTTGSSMLFIRPLIKMNSWRTKKSHIFLFFIFLISNMGGCLTPIGDPPLLMGFMRGVPFTWSLKLFPILAVNLCILLTVFYFIDKRNYRKDIAKGNVPDISKSGTYFKINGAHNLVFVVVIVGAVIFIGNMWIKMAVILLSAFLSYKTSNPEVRRANHFNWEPIKEVAVLFIGIFITMQPALLILKEVGPQLNITKAWQMFWTTGLLSSFLDNTPTYLVFFTTAGTIGVTDGIQTTVGVIAPYLLQAISCGAVFMGAGTYIGNAPNFMVKSIADENGIRMPGFFGYMLRAILVLMPVFAIDTLLFFRG